MNKKGIFITGAPRSGTSMITKVIDAHPDVAILMENIFQNRRRHWSKADFWISPQTLQEVVAKTYEKVKEPIIGNKVCTPDVWSLDDITLFCSLFRELKLVFILRDPVQVVLSRFRREDYADQFNAEARKNIGLDFSSRFLTYTSSWQQSVENYWKLREAHPGNAYIIYYEDFCQNFEQEAGKLFRFLGLPLSTEVLSWYKYPHHDGNGNLVRNLKYEDQPTDEKVNKVEELLDRKQEDEFEKAMGSIGPVYTMWKNRSI